MKVGSLLTQTARIRLKQAPEDSTLLAKNIADALRVAGSPEVLVTGAVVTFRPLIFRYQTRLMLLALVDEGTIAANGANVECRFDLRTWLLTGTAITVLAATQLPFTFYGVVTAAIVVWLFATLSLRSLVAWSATRLVRRAARR